MEIIKNNYLLFGFLILFIGANAYFIYNDNYYISVLPLALIVAYIGIFHTKTALLSVVFLTPFSINLEIFTEGRVGLFLPTEPFLFGLMLWIILKETKNHSLSKKFWRHPVVLSLAFYLLWILISSITSTNAIVSFKFLLMKSWFIVPCLFLGTIMFIKKDNIVKFLWCYSIGMTIIIIYTLIRHWGYDFGEKEGHWVMLPFFKDHTIYGAAVAISLFFSLGLLLYKKHTTANLALLLFMFIITFIGLYFSYTRAAWISVVFALGVWFFIRYKIKFRFLLFITAILSTITYFSWDQIQMRLEKNKHEHTTVNFEERIQSAANISSDASNLERINRWTAAWNMFKEKPVFGFGPATYAFEYAPYQESKKLTIISTNFGDGGNAHSEYLGPLAEMGLFGFISVIAFIGTLFYTGINLLINMKKYMPEEIQMYTLLLFIILAISTYFFHGILNNYLDTDKIAVPVYSAAAIIIAQSIRINQKVKNA